MSSFQTKAAKRTNSSIDFLGLPSLRAVARELTNAGEATSRRLADVDAIIARVDNIQRALAGAEQRVVQIAAGLHSPSQSTLIGSRSSLSSDISEIEPDLVQGAHDCLKVN